MKTFEAVIDGNGTDPWPWSWSCTVESKEVGVVEIKATVSVEGHERSAGIWVVVAVEVEFASWFRIEPRCRSKDFARGLEARTADPLWMLARQWQVGEFQGEDAGSPLAVNLEYSTQSLDRVRLGQSNIPIADAPLEAIAEREYLPLDWRTRVQVGQQLERFARTKLPGNAAEDFIQAYRKDYPLQPSAAEWEKIDCATRQFLQVVAGRVVDGRKLLEAIGGITPDQYNPVIAELKKWCEKLGIQLDPSRPVAWRNEQLDYRFEVNPPPQETQPPRTRLVAPNYRNGDLDWHTFNVVGQPPDEWSSPQSKPKSIAAHANRLVIAGTSPRWWEFEDGATNFGKLDVAKPDLAKLMLMEFVLIYGDDWFAVPLTVPMGNLVKIDNLKVFDVFGQEHKVLSARKPDSDPLRRWEVFALSPLPDPDRLGVGNPDLPGAGNILLIPPAAGFREESPPLEEVRFLRDEGANMVWGVEHVVRNGLGRPVAGFDAQRERSERQREAAIAALEARLSQIEQQLAGGNLSEAERQTLEAEAEAKRQELARVKGGAKPSGGVPRYRLATTVPENWIPFIPAKVILAPGHQGIRLHRAKMLRNADEELPTSIPGMSRLLKSEDDPLLWLEEATVPRSGVRVQLTAQRVRWVDGKTYVWWGRKVTTGRGEGSSGLRFDVITSMEQGL